ncbi:MAG TPA: hypothetical protein DEP51_00090 [Clostridiales bacterium]|jgi:hypothetical protein|nr:hypothetical protein [Clostridiales bacterium]
MQSKFYLLLKEAVTDDTSLIRVLDKIMNLINRYSRNYNGQIDEDLKSELIAKTIELVRKESIYKRFQ